MKGIKWLVYSNLWVSINVVALYVFSMLIIEDQIDLYYSGLIFFATLFAYNFQRYLKITGEKVDSYKSERHQWIGEHQLLIQVLSVAGFLGMSILSLVLLPIEMLLLSLPALIIVLFYTRGSKDLKAIRNIPLLKIFVISLVWLFVTLIIPSQIKGWNIRLIPVDLSVIIYLFVFIMCIPFDIRDVSHDRNRIKTIPVVVGVNGSKIIAISLMVTIMVYSVTVELWSMVITGVAAVVSLILSNENRSELFFAGWVEGLFAVLMLLQILIQVI